MSARNLRYIYKFVSEFDNDEFLQGVLAKLPCNHNQVLLDENKVNAELALFDKKYKFHDIIK